MSIDKRKLDLLDQHGFRKSFDNDVYFNRDTMKFFSGIAIDDYPIEWLQECIDEKNQEPQLYFENVVTLSDETKKDFLKQYYPDGWKKTSN